MCPGTLALAGAGLGAIGSIQSGIAQANAANYQSQVAANNAIIEQQNARYAASAAAANTEAAGLKDRAKFANVRASLAANNVDVNTGSAADTQVSQRKEGALDVATVANNDALQVYGYQTQAANEQAQSALDESQVGSDIAGGVLKGAGSLLSTPSVDSLIGSGGGATGSGAQQFAPGATGMPASLISGAPSVPDEYSWMQSADAGGGIY